MKYLITIISAVFLTNCGQVPQNNLNMLNPPPTIQCKGYIDYFFTSFVNLINLSPEGNFSINNLQANVTTNPLPTFQTGNSTAQNFAMTCMTTLNIPTSGNYTFQATATKGVRMFLNNIEVLNGIATTSSITVTYSAWMAAGAYYTQLDFFTNSEPYNLALGWSFNGSAIQTIPQTSFSAPNPDIMNE